MHLIRAVTFDAGGTLIEPWPSVGAVYAEVAREFGFECEPEQVTAAFATAWRERVSFGYSRAEWFEVVRQSFDGAREVNQAIFEAIFERFAESRCWHVYEDVLPTLERLRGAEVPLAVISNWDDRLKPLLDRLGLAKYFELIVISAEIGVHKPAPEIFHTAADQLGCAPAEILHIGDSAAEDVFGARAAGFQARRIRRAGVVHDDDLSSLTDLPDGVFQQTLAEADKGNKQTRTGGSRLTGAD